MAATFGHVTRHARTANEAAGRVDCSSASSPASSDASRASFSWLLSSAVAMAGHLPTQLLGHLRGERRDAAVLDAAGTREIDVEVCSEATGPAGEQHDAVAEPRRLAHVVA